MKKPAKRYNLVMQADLFNQVEAIAQAEDTTVLEILKRYIRLGLLIEEVRKNGGELVIREGDKERTIIII